MKKVLLITMIALSAVGCVRKPVEPTEPPRDSEIIAARNFIVDYDQRMEVAKKTILDCVASGKNLNSEQRDQVFKACQRIGYDTSGFMVYENRLSTDDKEQYRAKKAIAVFPISAELDGSR